MSEKDIYEDKALDAIDRAYWDEITKKVARMSEDLEPGDVIAYYREKWERIKKGMVDEGK